LTGSGVRHPSPPQRPERTVGGPEPRLRRRRGTRGVSREARVIPRAEPVFDESERNLVERGRPRAGLPAGRGGSGTGHADTRAARVTQTRAQRESRRHARAQSRIRPG
jgi:hypothetical protein